MKNIILLIKKRKKIGTNYCKKIRKNNFIPANIIFKLKKNKIIKLKHKDVINKIQKLKNIKNIKIYLKLKKKKIKTKIKEIQMHPYKNQIIHIDFIKI